MFIPIFREKFVPKMTSQQNVHSYVKKFPVFIHVFFSSPLKIGICGFINVSPRKMVFDVWTQVEVISVRVQGSSKEFFNDRAVPWIFVCSTRRRYFNFLMLFIFKMCWKTTDI
jgi:hypothetical protein